MDFKLGFVMVMT